MNKTFGQTLRDIRRSKNISQRELAKKVSVDFSYISKLENERIPPPAADTIVKICDVLEIPPDELLALTGKMPSDVKEIFSANPSAMQFLRTAKTLKLTEDEWGKLTKQIMRLRG
ncbi:MAG: helix-turn-helix domain-containing protein [bacterium]